MIRATQFPIQNNHLHLVLHARLWKGKLIFVRTDIKHVHGNVVPFRKRRYFGDYSEEDLNCPEKAKMMWELAKKQIDAKNKQLKVVRMDNFRLKKKVQKLENLLNVSVTCTV